ncbi:tyrosine-protein phosphatase [Nocardia harenae]|uniref:tyrosine-protein phosphatase n=1 Tax=Nocardia harenae TaxID=358707 RepID=UPI000831B92B|nr:tyrosine-protein phosphatase [Nocardia harenae]
MNHDAQSTIRRIPIPGTSNLRDAGGYPAHDGRTVATGRLYRAEALVVRGDEALHSIYDESAGARYRDLGVRTVIDLRADLETERAPSAWARACGAELVRLPVAEGGEGADTNYLRMLLDGELAGFGIADMTTFYTDMLLRRAGQLGAAYRILAEPQRLPVLVHCAAGKDRTGVFVALVLSSLGVPGEHVVRDYALTEVLRPNRIDAYAERFAAASRDVEAARALFGSPAAAMEATLRYLDERFGGAAGYLAEVAGVSGRVVDAVRANLLVR